MTPDLIWKAREVASWVQKHFLSLRGGTVTGPVTFKDDVTSTYLDNRYWQQWTRVLVVDPGGKGDYTTPEAACAYVATQSPGSTAKWLIMVTPGEYTISPFTVPTYCTLRGLAQTPIGNQTQGVYFVNQTITGGALITLDALAAMDNIGVTCQAQAGTTADVYAVYSSAGARLTNCYISAITLTTSYQTFGVYGSFFMSGCVIAAGSSYVTGAHFTAASQLKFCWISSRSSAGTANYGIVNAAGSTSIFHCRLGATAGDFFNTSINVSGGTVYINNTPYKTSSGTIVHIDRIFTDGSGLREAASATDVPLTLKGATGQSDDLTQWTNSSDTVLAKISALGGATINDNGADADFVVEGDTDTDLIHVDASTDRVGISEPSPNATLDVNGDTRLGDSDTNYFGVSATGDVTLVGSAKYERHIQIDAKADGTVANQPAQVDFFTAGGLQFASVGAKYAYAQWEIPDDWDGTDVYFEIDWFPDSGAMSGTDALRWTVEYRAIAEGEAINNGTSVTVDNGVGGDTADYTQYQTKHTRFTLTYNNANQPLTKQDHVYFKISRDTSVANDFAGTVTVSAYEIIYTSNGFPTSN